MKRKPGLPILMAIGLLMFFNTTQAISSENTAKPDAKYTFTSDWFTHNIPTWNRILSDMKGKPNLTYLEVGPYEGRSFLWVMDNILTHPSSKAIAIDTFDKFYDNDFEKTFLDNLNRSGHKSKVTVIKGSSQQKLRDIELNSIDLIYVDGDHGSRAVLMDALFSWDLLKNGGILIFDDYAWDYALPTEMRPTFALDVFLDLFQDDFEILIKSYQLIVRKTKKPCNKDMGLIKKGDISLACTYLGQYVYYWKPQRLFDVSKNYQEILLNKQEISMLEDTLINRKLSFKLELEKQKKNEYQELLTKLKLNNIYLSPKEK
jgi:predicted O-methyltransferase YrrM